MKTAPASPLDGSQTLDERRNPQRPFLGVGALLFDSEGQVLLVQRGKPPFEGWWALPGGIVEAGERLEDAIEREVLEETGLNVQAGAIATVFERIIPGVADGAQCEYHYVLVDFYCRVLRGILRPASDVRDARWWNLHDLDNLQMTAGTLDVVRACIMHRSTCAHITRPSR